MKYLAAVEALEKGMDQTEKREQKKGGKVKDEKYRWELFGLCCSLHHVLSNLDERWKGLHLVVLVILRKSSLTPFERRTHAYLKQSEPAPVTSRAISRTLRAPPQSRCF